MSTGRTCAEAAMQLGNLGGRPQTVDVLRGLSAVASALIAEVHLDQWHAGYRDLDVIGKLFLLNVLGGVVLAVAVLVWRHWLPALAVAGFGAVTLAGFLWTKQFGLFELSTTSWDYNSELAAGYEIGAVVVGLAAAAQLWRAGARRR